MNQTHTIGLFGVQRAGKSSAVGTIAEMAWLPIPKNNVFALPPARDPRQRRDDEKGGRVVSGSATLFEVLVE